MHVTQFQESRSIVLPDTVITNDDVLPGILLPWLGSCSLRPDSLRFTRISRQACKETMDYEMVHNYLEPQYGQRVFEIACEGVQVVTWMDDRS